jgi:AraC-like DNA-binding protein
MKKQIYPGIVKEYSATVNDLSFTLFLPQNMKTEGEIEEFSPFLHTHSYVEIFVCISGEISIDTELCTVKLFKNDIAFIPTGLLHSAMSGKVGNYFTVGIFGARSAVKGVSEAYFEMAKYFEIESIGIYRNAVNAADLLCEVAEHKEYSFQFVPVIKTLSALSVLSEINRETLGEALSEKRRSENRDIMRFLIIEDIINCSYADNLDCNAVANKLFITRRHLDRIVRNKYGKTLYELVVEARIKQAKKMLANTELSLEEIATRVGFTDAKQLKNQFLKTNGVSPSEYRNKR